MHCRTLHVGARLIWFWTVVFSEAVTIFVVLCSELQPRLASLRLVSHLWGLLSPPSVRRLLRNRLVYCETDVPVHVTVHAYTSA